MEGSIVLLIKNIHKIKYMYEKVSIICSDVTADV